MAAGVRLSVPPSTQFLAVSYVAVSLDPFAVIFPPPLWFASASPVHLLVTSHPLRVSRSNETRTRSARPSTPPPCEASCLSGGGSSISDDSPSRVFILFELCSVVEPMFISKLRSSFSVNNVSVILKKMIFRSVNIDELVLHFQTSSKRNFQLELKVINPALRALFSLQLMCNDSCTDAVSPLCCSSSYLDYTVHHCHSCSIASSSFRSSDLPTTSASNLRLSPTLVGFLAGLDNAVFIAFIKPKLCQRQGLYGDKLFRVYLLSYPSTARSCPLRRNFLPHLGREMEKGQFTPLPFALIPSNRRNTPKYCAKRLNRPETLCLVPDVGSYTLNQNLCDDNLLRFIPVTNYWLLHGNVEVRGFNPFIPFSPSSNSIVLSLIMKAKLALEIHLVSLRSFFVFRTDHINFSIKSSQIGLLLGVVQGLGASHQKLLPGNSPTVSYWCINVDFDYQLFFRTIALEIKVKLLHGVLHLAELDSPRIGFILLCFIMFSFIVVLSSMPPDSYASVVNF